MHPIFSSAKNLATVTGLWLVVSALLALLLQSQLSDHLTMMQAVNIFLPWFFVFVFFCLSNFYICIRFPISEKNFYHVLLIQLSSVFCAVFLWFLLGYLWVSVLGRLGQPDWAPLLSQQKESIATIAAILYCFWILAHYVYLMAKQHEVLERDALQKKLLISQLELQTLKASTHPHFLYNALNTVANLALVNPSKVYNLCVQISEFLRYSVNYSKNKYVAIGDELEHIQNYLAIERERFGDRLKVEFDVDEEARDENIIPLVLFPLVENAIKHGVDSLLDGGFIEIDIKCKNQGILIKVINTYDPLGVKVSGTQFGLSALKKRLLISYGSESLLKVYRENGDKFVVSMFVPGLKNA